MLEENIKKMPPKIKVFHDKRFKEAEPELYAFITGITGGKIPGGAMNYNRIYKIFIEAITPENRDMILEHIDRYNRFLHNKEIHKWIFDSRILNNDFLEVLLKHYRKEREKEVTPKEVRELRQVDKVFFCDLLNKAVEYMKKLYLELFPTLTVQFDSLNHLSGDPTQEVAHDDKGVYALFDDISYLYLKNIDPLEFWLMECPHHSILLDMSDIYELFTVVLKEFYGEGSEERHDGPTRLGALAFIEKILTLQKKRINYMIDTGNFENIFLFVRLFAKYDQNELVQFFFDLFPHLFIYDNAFDVICQRKSINVDFILPILKRFEEDDYREFPRYHIEDDSIMFLINKGNEEVTIAFINMIQTLNYISYLSFAIEKKQFAVIDYILKTILFYENGAILGTPYFTKKIAYTTLFYEEADYEKLGAVFGKYGIADKVPSREEFNMRMITDDMVKGSDHDLSCQICIEDGQVGDSLLECKKCHKLFHRNCIYQWIESKKAPTLIDGAGGEGGAEFEAEIMLDNDADWEDFVEEEEGEGEGEGEDEEDEDDEGPRRSPRLVNKIPVTSNDDPNLEESDDSDDSDYSGNDDEDDDEEDEEEERRKLIDKKICIVSQHYPILKCVHCQCLFTK